MISNYLLWLNAQLSFKKLGILIYNKSVDSLRPKSYFC